jgi:hypothetical protein
MQQQTFKKDKIELYRSSEVTHEYAEEAQKDIVSGGMAVSFCINRQSA